MLAKLKAKETKLFQHINKKEISLGRQHIEPHQHHPRPGRHLNGPLQGDRQRKHGAHKAYNKPNHRVRPLPALYCRAGSSKSNKCDQRNSKYNPEITTSTPARFAAGAAPPATFAVYPAYCTTRQRPAGVNRSGA